METMSVATWPQELAEPSGQRLRKPRTSGLTMVIDKGIGLHAFADLLTITGDYIDIVKFGFGTSALYPPKALAEKIGMAQKAGVAVIPGGTLLETAVQRGAVPAFFRQALAFGFDGIEVSDGTIALGRRQRDDLIREGISFGFRVFTEYGKKAFGSRIEADEFIATAERDLAAGAELVTVEGRESGVGVGLFDERGNCRLDELAALARIIPRMERVMWEAPKKEQQVELIRAIGPDVNLGNVQVGDVMALEAMRRGLRSDTFHLQRTFSDYVI